MLYIHYPSVGFPENKATTKNLKLLPLATTRSLGQAQLSSRMCRRMQLLSVIPQETSRVMADYIRNDDDDNDLLY